MNIACCQFDMAWEDKRANFAAVRRLIEKTEFPTEGAGEPTLLLLPEMFATGFSMNVAGVAEERRGETERFLAEIANDRGIYVLGGVVTRTAAGKGLNEAVLIGPDGEELIRYAKMHPYAPAGEAECYEEGLGPAMAAVGPFFAAPFICYDLRFPELFRAGVLGGADLFVGIASWPSPREEHWVTLLRARAIENQAFVAAVNRCGRDPHHDYPGRSLIVSPAGEVLADGGAGEGIVQARIDREDLLAYRAKLPFLNDVRARIEF